MTKEILFVILLLLNTTFVIALWHMSHNFMLKDKQPETRGLLKLSHEDAYRFPEYTALAAFVITDIIFLIFLF
jgi:hypothetical protein